MANRAIPAEVKAKALALLAEGNNKTYIAKNLEVDLRTITRWANEAGYGPKFSQDMRDDVSMLTAKLLKTNLETLITLQERIGTDEEWFQKQNARDLAFLVGITTDKSIRVLEAIAPNYEDEEDTYP